MKRERFVPGNDFLLHWIFQIPGEFSKRDSQPPLRSRNAEFVKRTFLFSDSGGFLPIILTELNSGGSVKPEIHWEAKLNLSLSLQISPSICTFEDKSDWTGNGSSINGVQSN